MEAACVHSCKGLCNALTLAEHREEDALKEYQRFAEQCDYPDVRQMLERLIEEHRRALTLLRETRTALAARFAVMDQMNESFV